jgi:ABC-type sugar transport system ATPase subunit
LTPLLADTLLLDTPLLEASGISKSFGGVHALRGADFDLRPGEVHALIGENGAGKSTLIKIMTGAVAAGSGTLRVMGQTLAHNSPRLSRQLGIAPIYQQPALFPHLSVTENIALFLEPSNLLRKLDWKARRKRAQELLERAGAAIDPDRLAETLTMPEQQIVEIAKAMGADAKILIMDEPTASLSELEVQRLFIAIATLRHQGAGIIYISHRLQEISSIADRITVLRDGQTIATRDNSSVTRDDLIHLMVGRDLPTEFPAREPAKGDIVLALRGIGNRDAGVRNVSFEIRAGEILGLAGLVGAGRTQLAEILFGLTPADSGKIFISGDPVRIASPTDAIRHGIGYVPADRPRHGVILEMPIASNISLADLPAVSRHGMLRPTAERTLAERYMGQLRIQAESPSIEAGALSGGNQQKVALARWLAVNPSVLILDEPTQGVDVGSKSEIHRIIANLAEKGMAILMISSDMPELLGISDRIAVMHAGSIRAILPREEATPRRILSLALGHEA